MPKVMFDVSDEFIALAKSYSIFQKRPYRTVLLEMLTAYEGFVSLLGPGEARRVAPPKLSEEARAARAPRPPEELVGALQDRIHPTSGRLLAAKPIATPAQKTEAIDDAKSFNSRYQSTRIRKNRVVEAIFVLNGKLGRGATLKEICKELPDIEYSTVLNDLQTLRSSSRVQRSKNNKSNYEYRVAKATTE
jgi:hypothetical protein